MNRQDIPLRILIGTEYIGAIIGKQGKTIRSITSSSRARVDIHRQENRSPETMISITGSPENRSKGCYEIMKVAQEEAETLKKGSVPLKILCSNSLCGRLIGKKGVIIKSIMEKSETHIVVSSVGNANNPYNDRVITVTGSYESISKAEEMISEKMRRCHQQDSQSFTGGGSSMGLYDQHQMMFNHPMMPSYNGYHMLRSPYPSMQAPSFYSPGFTPGPGGPQAPPPSETVYLYIPDSAVGAVIGRKGTNIRTMMKLSGARIKILQDGGSDDENGDGEKVRSAERKLMIAGSPEAQWKAQFYIFDKVKANLRNDEAHLRLQIMVPKAAVGWIIGKAGQNVKEMQRVSGARVTVPKSQSGDEDIPVAITGHFYAIQSVQCRIRALLTQRSSPSRRSRDASTLSRQDFESSKYSK